MKQAWRWVDKATYWFEDTFGTIERLEDWVWLVVIYIGTPTFLYLLLKHCGIFFS